MEYKIFAGVNSIACFPEPDVAKVIGYELHVDTSIRSDKRRHRHRDYAFGTGWVLKIIYTGGFDFAFGGNVYVDEYNPSSNISELYGIYETIRQLKDECFFDFGKTPLKIFCDNQKASDSIKGKMDYLKREENSEFKSTGKSIRQELAKISENHSFHWMKGHRPEDNFENHFADKIACELRAASEQHAPILGKFHLLTLVYIALSKSHAKLIDINNFFENNLKQYSRINSFLEEDNAVVIELHTTVIQHGDVFKTFWTVKDSERRYRGEPVLSAKVAHKDSSLTFVTDIISVIEAYKASPFFDPEKTIYLHSESSKYHLSAFHDAVQKQSSLRKIYNKLLLVTFGLNIIPTGVEVNHDNMISSEVHRTLKAGTVSSISKKALKSYRRTIQRN